MQWCIAVVRKACDAPPDNQNCLVRIFRRALVPVKGSHQIVRRRFCESKSHKTPQMITGRTAAKWMRSMICQPIIKPVAQEAARKAGKRSRVKKCCRILVGWLRMAFTWSWTVPKNRTALRALEAMFRNCQTTNAKSAAHYKYVKEVGKVCFPELMVDCEFAT